VSRSYSSAIKIRFEDGSELVTVTTLDYISETLSRLSLWHCGKAFSIDVHFQASDEGGHRYAHPSVDSVSSRVNDRVSPAGVGPKE
jgi:hypothetical protein